MTELEKCDIIRIITTAINQGESAMKRNHSEDETLSYVQTDEEILEYVSIPSDVYSTRVHQQGGRKKHSHTCIEMSYVLSGTATHVIRYADGTEEKKTISMGNYYILDHTVSHILFDVSKDFFLVNVLFQPCFINSIFTQYEPFDNILRYLFTDLHLHTMTDSVLNKNYYDEKYLNSVSKKDEDKFNQEMSKQISKLKDKTNINFITKTIYEIL